MWSTAWPCGLYHGPVVYCMALWSISWPCGLLHGPVVYIMALGSTAWPCGLYHGPVVYCMALGSTAWPWGLLHGPGVYCVALGSTAWPWGLLRGDTCLPAYLALGCRHHAWRRVGGWGLGLADGTGTGPCPQAPRASEGAKPCRSVRPGCEGRCVSGPGARAGV